MLNTFQNLGITTRIAAGFAAVIALQLIAGGITQLGASRSISGFTEYRQLADDQQATSSLDAQLLRSRLTILSYYDGLLQDRAVPEQEMHNALEQLAHVQRVIGDPDRKKVIAKIASEIAAYNTVWESLTDPKADGSRAKIAELRTIGERVTALTAKVTNSVNASRAELGEDLKASAESTVTWTIALLVLATAFGAAAAWWISRSIASPLGKLLDALRDIAQGDGDLTKRLPATTQDELGRVAGLFNEFVSKIQGVISELGGKNAKLVDQASTLSTTATSLSSGASSAGSRITQSSGSAQQTAEMMRGVHSTVDGMTERVRSAAAAVEEMSASISEVESSAKNSLDVSTQANELAAESNERMADMNTAAEEIGRVVSTIQEIAEQTNLLALNATIEAARAGDAGKGFAVVADEIKELARQTSESTGDIRGRIEHIQATTTTAVDAIARIADVIGAMHEHSQSIASAVGEQRGATEEIAQSLSQTSGSAESVARSVESSSEAAHTIHGDLAELETITKATGEQAESTRNAGQALVTVTSEIDTLVRRFKYE